MPELCCRCVNLMREHATLPTPETQRDGGERQETEKNDRCLRRWYQPQDKRLEQTRQFPHVARHSSVFSASCFFRRATARYQLGMFFSILISVNTPTHEGCTLSCKRSSTQPPVRCGQPNYADKIPSPLTPREPKHPTDSPAAVTTSPSHATRSRLISANLGALQGLLDAAN